MRVTIPFTVRGRLYLLRLIGPDGEALWIGEREGGGYLTFDAAFDPLPDAAAAYTLILTTDAPGAEPVLIPLTYAPDGTSENLLSFSAGDSPEESISRGRVSGESLILLTSEFGAAGQEYSLVKETG